MKYDFSNLIFMNFPEDEYTSILKRLDAGKSVYTTRVDQEYDKYERGIVNSPFGLLYIEDIWRLRDLSQHPFLSELTENQKAQLIDRPMDLIKFCRPPIDLCKIATRVASVK